MNLLIVESPTKARTLARFLGKDYSVEATTGHIKDLPKSTLGVDIEHNFKPLFEEVIKRAETIKVIKTAAKKASKIYLATDPDREGEAIAAHVQQILCEGDIRILGKRIVFHEITKEAVEEAIRNPRDIDKNLVNAQIARRVLDRLVGYKLSPLLWRKVRRGLSAGRVQTVVVRLIVEREREIEAFKPQEYWEIFVEVERKSKEKFSVKLIKIGDKNAEIDNGNTAKSLTESLKGAEYKVLSVDKHEVKKNPYPPFTTSTMTQAAARIFGWSAKRTMSVAQGLYEEGLITYHRTDSTYISGQAVEKVRKYIKEKYGDNYLPEKARFYKTTSKVAQEAHEAIRPTNVGLMPNAEMQVPNDGRKLYEVVWKRFVACQMTPSIYDETVIDVEASTKYRPTSRALVEGVQSTKYYLRASGQIMKFDGWRKVSPRSVGETEIILPDVVAGEQLKFIKIDPQQKFTEPPARYNEASLIKTLEKLGIGRPSTYAPTISTIQIRNYVEKDEGKFKPTLVGISVNDFLIGNFKDIFEYQFTAEMEENLDQVAGGKVEWEKIIGNFWKPFEKILTGVTKNAKRVKIKTEKLGRACPECAKKGLRPGPPVQRTSRFGEGPQGPEGELVIRIGRFGKFVSCSKFPDCKYTEKYIEKTGLKCPECKEGDMIIKKTRKGLSAGRQGRKFFGCSRYPECKWASWRKPK